jgi:hypothetical protein
MGSARWERYPTLVALAWELVASAMERGKIVRSPGKYKLSAGGRSSEPIHNEKGTLQMVALKS